jgi:hypothetical protein
MPAGTAVRPRRSDINFICCPFSGEPESGRRRTAATMFAHHVFVAGGKPSLNSARRRTASRLPLRSRLGGRIRRPGAGGPFPLPASARHEAGCDPATCWPDYSGREPEPGGVPESTCSTSAAAPARPSAMPPGRQAETGAGRGPLGADARAGPVARRQAGHRQRQLRAGRRADLPLPAGSFDVAISRTGARFPLVTKAWDLAGCAGHPRSCRAVVDESGVCFAGGVRERIVRLVKSVTPPYRFRSGHGEHARERPH